MTPEIVNGVLDYFLVFVITLFAVFLGSLGAFMVCLRVVLDSFNKANPQRREYMNEHEKSYRRKTV